jgi:hypothetical protein
LVIDGFHRESAENKVDADIYVRLVLVLVLVVVETSRPIEDDDGDEDEPACRTVWNPERILAFSPRLARCREGLPGVKAGKWHNPERVAASATSSVDATPSGL